MKELKALLASPHLIERTYPGKPMALDYLAAVLIKEGWEVLTIDVDVVGLEQYIAALKENRFDLIGITAMSIQVDEANLLAYLAREFAPEAVLLRGGPHDTYAYKESCLTHHSLYDAFVVGEGEDTLREIANHVVNGSFHQSRDSITGLAFWDGAVKFTGYRHPTNVNEYLPLRLFHHLSYNFDVLKNRKTAQVMGARGCANACFYCSESVSSHGRQELRRSIDNLSHEFASLKQNGYGAIYFDDPTFTRDKDWVFALCDEIERWGFIWGCNTRVDCLDEEIVHRMRAAGCNYLFCGLESAVPEILLSMNKTSRPEVYLEAAVRAYSALRKNNLPCSAFLIFGCPRRERVDNHYLFTPESDHDILASLDFAVNTLDPDYLSMNILRLLPGLPFSSAPQYECIRPTVKEPIHGGYYDSTWYLQTGNPDLRSHHAVYRAFEGCGSVNPPHMSPEKCYEILSLAVDLVNTKNTKPGTEQTIIVTDLRFTPFLKEEWKRGSRRYTLSSLDKISLSSDQHKFGHQVPAFIHA